MRYLVAETKSRQSGDGVKGTTTDDDGVRNPVCAEAGMMGWEPESDDDRNRGSGDSNTRETTKQPM